MIDSDWFNSMRENILMSLSELVTPAAIDDAHMIAYSHLALDRIGAPRDDENDRTLLLTERIAYVYDLLLNTCKALDRALDVVDRINGVSQTKH